MGIVALFLATAAIILAYFIFERAAVQIYHGQVASAVDRSDKVVQRCDRLWDSDLFTKTPEPLSNETDAAELRAEAAKWVFQVGNESTKLKDLTKEFEERQAAPNAAAGLQKEVDGYLSSSGTYLKHVSEIVAYMNVLVEHEMNMNEAIKAVPYAQGFINPAALVQRDAVLDTELKVIREIKSPASMDAFHKDTVAFLEDYVTIQKQTTAAYQNNEGLARLEQLGAAGQTLVRETRTILREDIEDVKNGQLGRDSKKARAHKTDTHNEIATLKSRYRF
jgi:hypothetical protein